MNGRFDPIIDDLSNAFSLLSPRPFSRQAQGYSSFSSEQNNRATAARNMSEDRPSFTSGIRQDFTDRPTFTSGIRQDFTSGIRQDPFFRDTMLDRHQKFMDEAFASTGRMSPRMAPMMPEWGYVGHASVGRTDSPVGGSRGGERIIPIRVEGGRMESPQLSQQRTQERSVRFHEDNSAASNGYYQQQQQPMTHHEPVVSAVYANGNKFQREEMAYSKPATTGSTGDLPSIGINLGKAPNLSSRLAKTTTYDEFADVLNRLPKRPEPRRDGSFDYSSGSASSPSSSIKSPVVTSTAAPPAPPPPPPPSRKSETHTVNLPSSVSRLQSSNTFGGSSAEEPNVVKMFDEIVNGPLADFFRLSQKIGGDVLEMANLTKSAFDVQRVFLWKACGMAKPNDSDLANLLNPTSEKIETIMNLKNSKRTSQQFNHISAIAEGIPAIGWVTVSPTPAPFIKEMSDASQFYTNRVLKDYKEKDATHVDWVKAWMQTLSELQKYVKQNHTTGLVWNSAPGSAPGSGSGTGASAGSPSSFKSGAPPPPPPPPMAGLDSSSSAKAPSTNQADPRAALFAELNKGLDITKGLRKVTDDMQTHKNPALKAADAAPMAHPVKPPKPQNLTNSSPASHATTGNLELEGGKKWIVENFADNKNIVVNVTDMKQVVYVYKCTGCIIQVKGKVNSITIDGCKRSSIVFDDLVSCVEVINCQSLQIQSLGVMPTLAIQKTDGCQVYLSPKSVNAEIVTSKSSEMNILVPDSQGDFREYPVPEQYKTVYDGRKLATAVVDIA